MAKPWLCKCIEILGNGDFKFERTDPNSNVIEMYLTPEHTIGKCKVGSVGYIEYDNSVGHEVFREK